MTNISLFLCNIISILISSLTTGILFHKIKKRAIQKYQNKYITIYEQKICAINKNLKNESDIRNDIEKNLQNKLQIINELNNKLSITEERIKLLNHYHQKYEQLKQELNHQINLNHTQELKLQELHIRLEAHQITTEEKHKLFINNEKRLTIQLENLANRIFTQHGDTINKQNQTTLNSILCPFRKQLEQFQNHIQTSFSQEEKNKNSLTYEIRNLHQLNAKITQETINLTQALKGNNKIQGNWGEVILTRALEASGMREGQEFHLQKHITKTDGRKLQPDVIIHLPQHKKVIIDSKVSLIAYERYFNSNNDEEKQLAINDHIHSLRTHMASLNKKNYQQLFEINTLDYILMFVPIESAFIIAIEKEPTLLTDAMQRNIMLTSPTTLLIALRTINNLWRHENQNYHAKKISDKASRLYDKLRLFIDDLNKIGQYLNKVEIIYNSAKNKFSEGKGNIISQIESFRTLGIQIKQPINSNTTPSTISLIDEKNNIIHTSDSENNFT